MKLYYYKDKRGNFGDDLNPWLWNRLIPGLLDEDDSAIFIGIGTLLNSLLPRSPLKVVFSSGVGYKSPPPPVDHSWKIYCVRGPLSAKALKIDSSYAATDGAALLRTVDFPNEEKKFSVSFIPHHKSHRQKWGVLCKRIGLNYIDPSESVDSVLSQIRSSKLVIAESMHGAIVADVFRVPWIPVNFHQHILDFKWMDWCQSVRTTYSPVKIPAFLIPEYRQKHYIWCKYTILSMYIRWLPKRTRSYLSSEDALNRATLKLQERFEQLKKDFLTG